MTLLLVLILYGAIFPLIIGQENLVISDDQIIHGNILESIKHKIPEIIEKLKIELETIIANVTEIALKIYEKSQSTAFEGKLKLETWKEKLHQKLDKLQRKNNILRQCIEHFTPEYYKIEEQTVGDIKKCSTEVVQTHEQQYRMDIEDDITAIKKDINKFGELISECIDINPLVIVKCIYEKLNQLPRLIDEVVIASKNAITIGRDRAIEVIKDVHACNEAPFDQANDHIVQINSRLEECVQENEN